MGLLILVEIIKSVYFHSSVTEISKQ